MDERRLGWPLAPDGAIERKLSANLEEYARLLEAAESRITLTAGAAFMLASLIRDALAGDRRLK